MSDTGPARTMFASKALQMHALFGARFKKEHIGSKLPRRVKVQEIDVETTGGGKQARMSVTLIAEGQPSANLVCGWIDVGASKVRMRSHATLVKMYEHKLGKPLEISKEEYQKFLNDAQAFVTSNAFEFEIYDEDLHYQKKPVQATSSSSSGGNTAMIVGGIIVLAAIAAAIIMFMR